MAVLLSHQACLTCVGANTRLRLIIARRDHIDEWRCRLQKFGLDSLKSEKMSALELEIAKEKSTALGIAGKKLRDSIAEYRQSISHNDVASEERDRLLASVLANVQALIVQRELVGFIHDNMHWINQTYDVPKEALAKLGAVQPHVNRVP